MSRRPNAAGLRSALAVMMCVAAAGCGSSPITPARIQAAIAPTFANLIHAQLFRLRLPPVAAADIKVTASCRRPGMGIAVSGAGDWECRLVWEVPNRQILRDTYDLSVATDGCFTATVTGDHLGGPTLETQDGLEVRNLLYAFEGCFDTTA